VAILITNQLESGIGLHLLNNQVFVSDYICQWDWTHEVISIHSWVWSEDIPYWLVGAACANAHYSPYSTFDRQ